MHATRKESVPKYKEIFIRDIGTNSTILFTPSELGPRGNNDPSTLILGGGLWSAVEQK